MRSARTQAPRRPPANAAGLERATLARARSDAHPEAQQAATSFDALPTAQAQMALVREIVATRARELTMAYRNVAAVLAGYKASTAADGEELYPRPSVVFVVKRKWTSADAGPPEQRLPARLLTYGQAEAGAGVDLADCDRRLYPLAGSLPAGLLRLAHPVLAGRAVTQSLPAGRRTGGTSLAACS